VAVHANTADTVIITAQLGRVSTTKTPSATRMLMPTKQENRHAASSTAADDTSAQRSSACKQNSLFKGKQGMDSTSILAVHRADTR